MPMMFNCANSKVTVGVCGDKNVHSFPQVAEFVDAKLALFNDPAIKIVCIHGLKFSIAMMDFGQGNGWGVDGRPTLTPALQRIRVELDRTRK